METETVIQLGGSFEATIKGGLVTFNKPVTNIGMHYIEEIAKILGQSEFSSKES